MNGNASKFVDLIIGPLVIFSLIGIALFTVTSISVISALLNYVLGNLVISYFIAGLLISMGYGVVYVLSLFVFLKILSQTGKILLVAGGLMIVLSGVALGLFIAMILSANSISLIPILFA